MAQSIEEDLLQVIKKDDIKAFDALMDKTQCGAYRLGRFPVLSLLYLYKSKKILSAYEETFLKLTNYVPLDEPLDISHRFATKAKKSLRLYFNEVVSPLEMLLILDKTRHLKQIYPTVTPSSAVKARLKSIYYIKYSLGVRFEGNDIIIDRRPLTYLEKKRIATICLCAALAIVIIIGVPVTTVSLIPKPIEGEVTKLSQLDFNSTKEYVLKKDIVVPENYTVGNVNCKIIGEGNKIIFKKGASLGQLNGKLSDMTIESSGSAIFTTISPSASIENAILNVNSDIETSEVSAFLAITNYGTIDGLTVNVNGKINALANSTEATEELTFGGLVQNNSSKFDTTTQKVANGTVKNCKVNYSQFNLAGEASANAAFGGVVGVNSGYVQDCTVTGEISADTFDVAGVCSLNRGVMTMNINEANITQISDSTGWNPIVSGIVLTNAYVVEYCQNKGNISATSNCEQLQEDANIPTVSVSGIAYINSSSVVNCSNSGNITGAGKGDAYVGGIAAHAYSTISNCFSSGEINVAADVVYAGGILGCSEVTVEGYYVYFGTVDHCISESKIRTSVISDKTAYVGGITGYIKELGLEQQKYEDGNITTYIKYFGGAVTNCYFVGEYLSNASYFGNIVGVIGANIFEVNSYSSGTKEFYNLDGNLYLNNNYNAIGSTITPDGDYAAVEDKGASATTIDIIKASQSYKDILSALEYMRQ